MKVKYLMFFPNGNTACFNTKGQQIPEFQKSWFVMFITFLESEGVNIEDIDRIDMPNGQQAKPFKLKDGGWNWEIEE